MPDLDTKLHLQMLSGAQKSLPELVNDPNWLYGLHWGDPENHPALGQVLSRFIQPHLHPDRVCVEIGPGGGRWTRYLTGFKTLYAVDYHQELLDVLRKHFHQPNLIPIKNNGTDFPGIPATSVDFLFSFGVFVHLDLDLIEQYLRNMHSILKPDARIFIQYSDKTKPAGKANEGFSVNTPTIMRGLVTVLGYTVLEEDVELLNHSSMMLLCKSLS